MSSTSFQTVADRIEIEALRGEFSDAVMMGEYDRLASLFAPDGAVRMPHINAKAVGRELDEHPGYHIATADGRAVLTEAIRREVDRNVAMINSFSLPGDLERTDTPRSGGLSVVLLIRLYTIKPRGPRL